MAARADACDAGGIARRKRLMLAGATWLKPQLTLLAKAPAIENMLASLL